jgi:hypothetical protein
MEVIATRVIHPGEELSITCNVTPAASKKFPSLTCWVDAPLNLYYEGRKEALDNWGFECSCSACSTKSGRDQSDKNRKRIDEIASELSEEKGLYFERITALGQEMLSLVETEGFGGLRGLFCELISDAFLRTENVPSARVFAQCAADEHTLYEGPESDEAKRAVALLRSLYEEYTAVGE